MSLVAKSADNSTALAARLRQTIQKLDPEMPYSIRTVASFSQSTLSNWLVLIQMITIMGVLGLILALVGLYGLISYSVSRRTAEIGVRMAMGASRSIIMRLVLRRATFLCATGVVMEAHYPQWSHRLFQQDSWGWEQSIRQATSPSQSYCCL